MVSNTVFDRIGHPNRSWDGFGPNFGSLGVPLPPLGQALGPLGPLGASFGAPWGAPGRSWTGLRGSLGPSWAPLDGPEGSLEGSREPLGPQGSILEPPGVDFGSIWGRFSQDKAADLPGRLACLGAWPVWLAWVPGLSIATEIGQGS